MTMYPTWSSWCDESGTTTYELSSTSSTSCMSCDHTWIRWTVDRAYARSATTAATTSTWGQWVTDADEDCARSGRLAARRAAEAWERDREEREARAARSAALAAEAEARAAELLKEHLDADQRREYEAEQAFHVVTASGTRYRIRHGWAGNVDELDGLSGRAVRRYCIHPLVGVPKPDNMLAQKLMLETDEPGFRRIANVTVLEATA